MHETTFPTNCFALYEDTSKTKSPHWHHTRIHNATSISKTSLPSFTATCQITKHLFRTEQHSRQCIYAFVQLCTEGITNMSSQQNIPNAATACWTIKATAHCQHKQCTNTDMNFRGLKYPSPPLPNQKHSNSCISAEALQKVFCTNFWQVGGGTGAVEDAKHINFWWLWGLGMRNIYCW